MSDITRSNNSNALNALDCVSRQAAIDALDGELEITGRTNAEAVKGYIKLVKDRLERLSSVQSVNYGSTNLIDKNEVLDAIHNVIFSIIDTKSPLTVIDKQLLSINKAITTKIKELPSAEPEQDSKVSFWKERAKEYEDIILRLVTEQAKGIKLDSIEITGERIIFKKSQPERKKGKWTEKEVIHAEEAKEVITEWQSCRCSVCGRYHTQPYMYYFDNPNYCSWCGAKMDGKETEDE